MVRRKRVFSLLVAVALVQGVWTRGQVPGSSPAELPPSAKVPGADRLSASELEELLGPVALYPDELLANVLAASVYPGEVSAAYTFTKTGGTKDQINSKPWDASVRAVAQLPDVINMMGDYPDWTVAVGQAYLLQPKDVMAAIQSLRLKAKGNGALQSTVEQKVVYEDEIVYIRSYDPEIIYVPIYDPDYVYVEHYGGNTIGYGAGIVTGLILANNLDCDWNGGHVGYGWGTVEHHRGDTEININGDVNVGNRNQINSQRNASNRIGNEGNVWAPDRSKALATGQASKLNQYKAGKTKSPSVPHPKAPAQPAVRPSTPSKAALQTSARPSQSAAGMVSNSQRPSQGMSGSQGGAYGAVSANKTPSRTPSGGSSNRTPQAPPRQPAPSAYNGGNNTRAESQRGASSRSGGGAPRAGSGGRVGGGGGSRRR